MAEQGSAPVLPDPEWIVGKHALMNVRARRRLGRTEIDPLRWRIPDSRSPWRFVTPLMFQEPILISSVYPCSGVGPWGRTGGLK